MADLTGTITTGISLTGTITIVDLSTGDIVTGSNISGQIVGGPPGPQGDPATNDVTSVNTRTGAVTGLAENSDLVAHTSNTSNPHSVTKAQVGLGSVPNTDFTGAVAANTAKNSYPTGDATKLAGIAAGAEVNVQSDWNAVSGDAEILNKPTIPTVPVTSVNTKTGAVVLAADDISDSSSTHKFATAAELAAATSAVQPGDNINTTKVFTDYVGGKTTSNVELDMNATVTGTLSASNLSGSNTGDQDLSALQTIANLDTTGTLGTSDTKYPSQKAAKTYTDNQITANATPDATTSTKGKVQLAGDLGGTAASPTTPTAVHLTGSETIAGSKTFTSQANVNDSSTSAPTGAGSQTLASNLYLQSRAQNLITNGSGLLGNKYNFSGVAFTYDQLDIHGGLGSMKSNGNHTAATSDELIPVNPIKNYRLGAWVKAGDPDGSHYTPANIQYFGLEAYDIDGNPVLADAFGRYPGAALTTLAADLNPGATTISLTSATGWYNGATSNFRQIVWYGYTNSKGYTYPDYTYSRNYTRNALGGYNTNGAWAVGGISGNTITLTAPWPYAKVTAGTAVANSAPNGGTYQYTVMSGQAVPNAWTYYEGNIGGYDLNGVGYANQFRYGTAYVKLLFLINYHNVPDSIRYSDIWFSEMSSSNLEPATATVQGVVSTANQSLGAGDKYFAGKLAIGNTTPAYQLDQRTTATPSSSQLHISSTLADNGFYLLAYSSLGTYMSHGAAYISGAWYAKEATAMILGMASGILYFYVNTGLTIGSSFTPILKYTIDASGNATSVGNTIGVNLQANTAGGGLQIKGGTNTRLGSATLVAGTKTVSNTTVTANTKIFLTPDGGTMTNVGTPYVSARVNGTSFTITSTNPLDTSSVDYMLVEST